MMHWVELGRSNAISSDTQVQEDSASGGHDKSGSGSGGETLVGSSSGESDDAPAQPDHQSEHSAQPDPQEDLVLEEEDVADFIEDLIKSSETETDPSGEWKTTGSSSASESGSSKPQDSIGLPIEESGSGNTSLLPQSSEGLNEEIPPQSVQPSPTRTEEVEYSLSNLDESLLNLEKTPQSSPKYEPLADQSDHAEDDTTPVPSSGARLRPMQVPASSGSELETNPTISQHDNILGQQATATTQTQVVSIEDGAPTLSPTTQSIPVTSMTLTSTPFHSPYFLHMLHLAAQTVNVPSMSQGGTQVSPSISNDPVATTAAGEGIPSTSVMEDPLSIHRIRVTQSEATPMSSDRHVSPMSCEDTTNTSVPYHALSSSQIRLGTTFVTQPVICDLPPYQQVASEVTTSIPLAGDEGLTIPRSRSEPSSATQIPNEDEPYQQAQSEGPQTSPTPPPQPEITEGALQHILNAMDSMHHKLDDKLNSVQAELTHLNNNMATSNQLEEVRGLVSVLTIKMRAGLSSQSDRTSSIQASLTGLDGKVSGIEQEVKKVENLQKSVDGLHNTVHTLGRFVGDCFVQLAEQFEKRDDVKEGEKQKEKKDNRSKSEGEEKVDESAAEGENEGPIDIESDEPKTPSDQPPTPESDHPSSPESEDCGQKRKRSEEEEETTESDNPTTPIKFKTGRKKMLPRKKSKMVFSSMSEEDKSEDSDNVPIASLIRKTKPTPPPQPQPKTQPQPQSDPQPNITTSRPKMSFRSVTQRLAEAQGMTEAQYIEMVNKQKQEKADQKLAYRIERATELEYRLKKNFVMNRYDKPITSCIVYKDANNHITIDCTMQGTKTRRSVKLLDLWQLGYMEWKNVAQFINKRLNKELRDEVMEEIILLVEAAHDIGQLNHEVYKSFCVAFNIKIKKRPAGLTNAAEEEVPSLVPEGVVFVENMYVKTDDHEGFCYRDNNGVECFQSVRDLPLHTPYAHMFSLLELCTEPQNLPFRKRLVRALFYQLGKIENEDPAMKKKCKKIREEHRQFEKDNLEEIELVERGRRQKYQS